MPVPRRNLSRICMRHLWIWMWTKLLCVATGSKFNDRTFRMSARNRSSTVGKEEEEPRTFYFHQRILYARLTLSCLSLKRVYRQVSLQVSWKYLSISLEIDFLITWDVRAQPTKCRKHTLKSSVLLYTYEDHVHCNEPVTVALHRMP